MAIDYKSSLSRYRKYLTLMQKQPLWQASLLVIFSLILLIALLLFVLRPTLITISSLLGQIDSQQQVERQLDAKIAALQQAQQLLNSIQPRLVYLDRSLPTSAMLGTWAEAVQTIASGSGIIISDISLADIPLSNIATNSAILSSLTQIPFTIQATSDYTQLINFVDTIEKLPRLAILTSVQFNQDPSGQIEMLAKGTIDFTYITNSQASSTSP